MQAFSFTNSISKKQYTRHFLQFDLMKPRRMALYVCAMVLLFAGVLGLALPDSLFGATRLVMLELSVPILVILLIIALRAKVRASYEGQKRLLVDVQIRVSDEGIFADAAGIASKYPWSAIVRSVETKDMLLLYISKGSAILINKSDAPTEALTAIRNRTTTPKQQ